MSRIVILLLSIFVIGTDNYVIAGLLPDVAWGLHVSEASAGQLITAFAIVYAVSSPILATAFGSVDRKRILWVSMVVFSAGNLLVAWAPSFEWTMAGRVIAAMAAAIFTPTALGSAAMIAPADKRGSYMSYVMTGLTVATIVGVPLGVLTGSRIGYRSVFVGIALLALLAVVALFVAFKPLAAPPSVSLKERGRAVWRPGVIGILLVTVLVFLSAFTVYSYIGPYLTAKLHISVSQLSLFLLVFGISGAVGNLAGGRSTDKFGSRTTALLALASIALAFTGFTFSGSSLSLALVLTVFWGMGGWLLAPAQQSELVARYPKVATVLISWNSSAMYLGMGLSGVLGGFVLDRFGALRLPLVGAVVAVLGILVLLMFYPRRASTNPDGGR
jgi:predicted MFS family arabinose efflux permease